MNNIITELRENAVDIKNSIYDIEGRIDRLRVNMDKLTNTVSSIEKKMEEFRESLDKTETKLDLILLNLKSQGNSSFSDKSDIVEAKYSDWRGKCGCCLRTRDCACSNCIHFKEQGKCNGCGEVITPI